MLGDPARQLLPSRPNDVCVVPHPLWLNNRGDPPDPCRPMISAAGQDGAKEYGPPDNYAWLHRPLFGMCGRVGAERCPRRLAGTQSRSRTGSHQLAAERGGALLAQIDLGRASSGLLRVLRGGQGQGRRACSERHAPPLMSGWLGRGAP
jgi:hypothetical protein